jgi:hypothetical protein
MLAEGMRAVERWEATERGTDAEYQAAEQATRCFAELDAALKDGARLPVMWWPSLPRRSHHCGLCGRAFKSEDDVDEHLDRDHEGEHGHA